MESEVEPGLHRAAPRVRLAKAGWEFAVAVGFVLLFIARARVVSFGVVFLFVGLFIVEATASYLVLRNRNLSASTVLTRVESPAELTFEVTAGPGIGALLVTPTPLAATDFGVDRTTMQITATDSSVIVRVPDGPSPCAKSVATFTVSLSLLGFVKATQQCALVANGYFERVPALPPLDEQLATRSLDEVGRLRQYNPGDRRSRIAWQTTARTGTMHVRDSSIEDDGEVAVVVDLGLLDEILNPEDGVDPMEIVTSVVVEAGSVVASFLEGGTPVRLITSQVDPRWHRDNAAFVMRNPNKIPVIPMEEATIGTHQIDALVVDRDMLLERLAHADCGPLTRPPAPYIEVTSSGHRWVTS